MGKSYDIVVVGRACIDHLCVVERYPVEDAKVPMGDRLVEGGGQGATAACCAARLGGRVAYVGCVGDDGEGRFCLKRLADYGVDTSHVKVVSGVRTPYAYVFVTSSSCKRTIIYEPGSLPPVEMSPELLDLFRQSGAVLLGPQATNLAAQLLGENPLPPVVYDCERDRPGLKDMMALADYFIPHYGFLERGEPFVPGASKHEKILALAGMVSGRLIVTDGENGACYPSDGGLVHVHPPLVAARDTTGAGDNFHGAFALALSRGFGLHDAVRFATAVASLSCRELGGRAGIPDFEEALSVMKSLV